MRRCTANHELRHEDTPTTGRVTVPNHQVKVFVSRLSLAFIANLNHFPVFFNLPRGHQQTHLFFVTNASDAAGGRLSPARLASLDEISVGSFINWHMPPLRSVAALPSAAAHLAWMCVVAGVVMCKDGIIKVTRCNVLPLSVCVQYYIGHSSVTVEPSSSALQLLQLASASWQVKSIRTADPRECVTHWQLFCGSAAPSCDAPSCLNQTNRDVFLAHVVMCVCKPPPPASRHHGLTF
jgi:hypothetical protein